MIVAKKWKLILILREVIFIKVVLKENKKITENKKVTFANLWRKNLDAEQ